MNLKEILWELNWPAQAKKYGIPLWQHPQFLFLVNGILIILLDLSIYLISLRFFSPEIAALIVLFFTIGFLIISYLLTHTSDRLLEINRLKSEFLDIVLHEIRNPITAFSWVLEVLMTKERDNEKQEYLQILKENTKKIQNLIKDLVIVSREEFAKIPSQKSVFSLEEITKEVLKDFEKQILSKNLKISLNVSPIPKIISEPEKIKIVISNLLENAILYSSEGGKIAIDLFEEKNKAVFQIIDNGRGIPKEDQRFIFQKFFRAKNSKDVEGTGLGLYICKTILQKLKGQIGFQSEEGKGSKFYFSLPLK